MKVHVCKEGAYTDNQIKRKSVEWSAVKCIVEEITVEQWLLFGVIVRYLQNIDATQHLTYTVQYMVRKVVFDLSKDRTRVKKLCYSARLYNMYIRETFNYILNIMICEFLRAYKEI